MIALAAEELIDLRRWALCAALVVLAHGGIAAAMVTWRDAIEPSETASAIVIEFAPVPVAPAVQPSELAPGPEQTMSDASPNRPTETLEEKIEEKVDQKVEVKVAQKVEEPVEAKPIEEPPPEVKPAPNPDVAIEPPPPQEVKEAMVQRQVPVLPAPDTTAPQPMPVDKAKVAAAPTQAQPNPNTSKAVQTWRGQIVALIERNKRYPAKAESRGQQGVARVFFSLDRQGQVIDSRVVTSSGVTALDEEALALLRRAQPFPKPPPELAGDRVDLMLPLRFNLR
jgi:periplasmic protein TonB